MDFHPKGASEVRKIASCVDVREKEKEGILPDTIHVEREKDPETKRMRIRILSFGFKHGLPAEADLLIDVRFIPNPYYVHSLKELDGKDMHVQQFVKKWPETRAFLEKYHSLLEYLIPLYEKEEKACLTLAIGCTGGRHRSVVIAEEIFTLLKDSGREITLTHRDIGLV